MNYQTTIKRTVSFTGIGLTSGKTSGITFRPAQINTGITLRWMDIKGHPSIDVRVSNLIDSGQTLSQKIGLKNYFAVRGLEHALAAIIGLGIDNIGIELSSFEPPLGDGSALPFVESLEKAGISVQNSPKNVVKFHRPLWLIEANKSGVVILPDDKLIVTCFMQSEHPAVGLQMQSFVISPDVFINEIAWARTWVYADEVGLLRDAGIMPNHYSRVGTPVIVDEGGLNQELRSPTEFVRHRILDLLGIMCILSPAIEGHIIGINPTMSLGTRLLKKYEFDSASIRGFLSEESIIHSRKIIRKFQTMIDRDAKEKEEMQKFLEEHPWIFGLEYKEFRSEKRAGDPNRLDFLLMKFDGEFEIVELKRASDNLFCNKKGKLFKTHTLNKAIEQVRNYQEFYLNHLDFIKSVEGRRIYKPKALIVIGRTKENEKEKLQMENSYLRGEIKIVTYDQLVDSTRNMIDAIRNITLGHESRVQ